MLDYDLITSKIESKISDYSMKENGVNVAFYTSLQSSLQKQLDILQSKGKDGCALQDLIIAWQTYIECEQKRRLKFYTDNKFVLIAAFSLVISLGINIVHSINKHNPHG